jgi:glucose/arabinose dehydrogenase
VLELDPDTGAVIREVATGAHAPWNGVAFADGALFVAQGGQDDCGRIVRIDPASGAQTVLVDRLPSLGDHHTNGPVVVDGWVYFGQGTATNSAVVGEDNHAFGWLAKHPRHHDVPCQDVRLTGTNFTSANPLTEADDQVQTGAFLPFGTASEAGQTIAGRVPCSGAVLRVRARGGNVELVAWGFRNPYGLAATPDGTVLVTDNGYDVRGSRPVFGSADMLWRLEPGRWYGWPDYAEARPLTMDFYSEADGDTAGFVLAEHPGEPPEPLARFAVHASANGLDVSRSAAFGHDGQAFVALFGDMSPSTGKIAAPVGFSVVRVDLATSVIEDFARNDGDSSGPASKLGSRGLERPIAVRFDPDGHALYVVDFGVLRMGHDGPDPQPETGVLWRITREAHDAR